MTKDPFGLPQKGFWGFLSGECSGEIGLCGWIYGFCNFSSKKKWKGRHRVGRASGIG